MIRLTHINPYSFVDGELIIGSLRKFNSKITQYYNRYNKDRVLAYLLEHMCIHGGIHEVRDPNGIVPWDMIKVRNSGIIRRTRNFL